MPPLLPAELGVARRIVADPSDGRFALALFAGPPSRVLRTNDGGANWDDVTANLGDVAANGVAFDRATGAIYLATSAGVYLSYQGARSLEPVQWRQLRGLGDGAAVADVRLDEPGTRLLAAVDGPGIFETIAPHRARLPVVLHSADYGQRAAAPGSTLSILGSAVESVTANSLRAVVLSSTPAEAQIQLPYDVAGDSLRLVANRANAAPLVFGLPLRATSPSVLIDGDGFPVVIDADSGVQIDALNPVHPGARLQVLASGLGRVRPDSARRPARPGVAPAGGRRHCAGPARRNTGEGHPRDARARLRRFLSRRIRSATGARRGACGGCCRGRRPAQQRHPRLHGIGMKSLYVLAPAPLAAALCGAQTAPAPGAVSRAKTGEKLAPYPPTPDSVVERMLRLAELKPGERLMDIGSGDGRIVIMGAAKFQAISAGVEIDPPLVRQSRVRIHALGLDKLATIIEGDALQQDDLSYDVIAVYLLPSSNLRLRPILDAQLRPGTRIVAHDFLIRGWKPERELWSRTDGTGRSHTLYLYRTPQNQR